MKHQYIQRKWKRPPPKLPSPWKAQTVQGPGCRSVFTEHRRTSSWKNRRSHGGVCTSFSEQWKATTRVSGRHTVGMQTSPLPPTNRRWIRGRLETCFLGSNVPRLANLFTQTGAQRNIYIDGDRWLSIWTRKGNSVFSTGWPKSRSGQCLHTRLQDKHVFLPTWVALSLPCTPEHFQKTEVICFLARITSEMAKKSPHK